MSRKLTQFLLLLFVSVLLNIARCPFCFQSLGHQFLLQGSGDWFGQTGIFRNRLEFVHIPKTGGTIIESVAARGGVSWTICHFLSTSVASEMSMNVIHCPETSSTSGSHFHWTKTQRIHDLVWWHLPPSYFYYYRSQLPANPFEGADLFAVVRNPYSRLISEYYYQQTWLVAESKRKQTQDVGYFNEWIATKLQQYAHFKCYRFAKSDLLGSTDATKSFLSFDGHLISQFDYIYDNVSTSGTSPPRIVKHVLKFESLRNDFTSLMLQYGLEHLTPLPNEHVRKSLPKELGLLNITLDNLPLIERVYKQDFVEFGYKMISSAIPDEILQRNYHLVSTK